MPLLLQLSKEVRALRDYEAALLDGYHTYLKGLLRVRYLSRMLWLHVHAFLHKVRGDTLATKHTFGNSIAGV